MVAPHLNPITTRTRPQAVFWAAFGVLLAFAAQQLWQKFHVQDLGDPVAASLVAFEKQDRLTVFSAQLSPVVAADDAQLFGMITSRQVAVIPARVDYALDMGQLDRGHFKWDAAAHRMDVELPPLIVSQPNLDEGHAQYLREGVWIGREAQGRLTRANTLLAEKLARQQAANPVLMDLARSAAKDAITRNLRFPLQAAGYGDATVRVRFPGEQPAK